MPENNETMLDRYTPAKFNDTRCFRGDLNASEHTVCPVKMDVQYLDAEGYNTFPSTVTLMKDEYWKFTNETLKELKEFIGNVTSFTLTYFIKVDYPETQTLSTSCFDWTIQQKFDYTNRGIIRLTLHLQ